MRSIPTAKSSQQRSLCTHDYISEFFDVKFYPYDPDGADPVFAAISKKHVRRLSSRSQLLMRLLRHAVACDVIGQALTNVSARFLFAGCLRLMPM